MDRAEALINYKWVEVYPEYWIMSNTNDLSSFLYNIPLNKVELRCCEGKEPVSICSLGDGMKKKPYFAHRQNKEKDEDNSECNLRTSNELYDEIYKFDKPRANTRESALHIEMKKFAVSKFWGKENAYVVLKDEDIITYNREDKTKLRADLLAGPLINGTDRLVQRSEQFIFEGQTERNTLSVKHIEKAIEYRKVGFLEENIINAFTIEHLNKATYISNSYMDILDLKGLNKSQVEDRIKTNKLDRGAVIDMLERTSVDKLSGYYAFHGETEFLFALKEYSNNHLLFMYIPISEDSNKLEEKYKHKRRLILASVLDTITIKDDYCVIGYLYFEDITYINDIADYKKALSIYKNKTIQFSQRSLKEVASKYTGVISEKDRQISNLMDHNESLEIEANSLRYELNKISTEKEAEIKALKSENSKLTELLARRDTEFTDEAEQKIKTGLLKEYADLEQLKKQYSSSYEEIAAEVSENIRAELDAKYKEYNSALKDGHYNMQKRVKCQKRHLKYINSLGGVASAELPNVLKCPNISNDSLQAYMNEYLEVAIHTCGKCNKYE